MKILILAILLSVFSATLSAKGSGDGKENNPLDSATLSDGCVLVFADGIDEESCIESESPAQSGQQFICQVLMVCSRD